MSENLSPPPYQDELVYPPRSGPAGELAFLMTPVWQQYFVAQNQRVNQTPFQFANTVDLAAQQASIGATAIPLPSLASGMYRVSLYARITQPGTVSSSLIGTISFTDGGATASKSTAAQTGNTTGSILSESWPIQIDQATPINYATTYASVGATDMQYALRVIVEQMPS